MTKQEAVNIRELIEQKKASKSLKKSFEKAIPILSIPHCFSFGINDNRDYFHITIGNN